uniref:Uncharacterized protein n=1 Tax=Nymphaea colorata TaxID=210225 RepID=A0A5K0V3P9_9MAGN
MDIILVRSGLRQSLMPLIWKVVSFSVSISIDLKMLCTIAELKAVMFTFLQCHYFVKPVT